MINVTLALRRAQLAGLTALAILLLSGAPAFAATMPRLVGSGVAMASSEQVGSVTPPSTSPEPVVLGADYLARLALEVLLLVVGLAIAALGTVRYRANRRARVAVRAPTPSPATRTTPDPRTHD